MSPARPYLSPSFSPAPRLPATPLPFSRATARRLLILSLLSGAAGCGAPATGHQGTGGAPASGAGGAVDGGPDAPGGSGGSGGSGGTAGAPASTGGSGGASAADAGVDQSSGTGGAPVGAGGQTGMGGARGTGGAPVATDQWQVLEPPFSRKLDLLFMVDNSQSMLPLQAKLLASFPVFMNTLKALPMGLPDVHIAVVSSDAGPGKFDLADRHCALSGDGGRFQTAPRGSCATSPLPAGQTFLQASNNQLVKNYPGDITDAFTCIAALGDQGCGFESQLKSVRLALDPTHPVAGNEGFLREDAFLSVVLITNEDDCSLPDDSDLVDPTQNLVSDPLGPLWSYRCNEFGHLCNVNGTLQPPPRGPASNLQDCVSNDGPTGKLTKLSDEIAFLKSLKSDPNRLLVSAITGPATPYSIEMIQQGADVEPHPNVVHSCTTNAGEYGDPSVRIQQWVKAFGANGLLQSICADSFAPALQGLGNKIAGVFGPSCVSGPFPATSGTTQPPCRVVDRMAAGDGGTRVETLLPNCAANGNTPPCWTLTDDASGCLDGKRLSINRGAILPAPDLTTAFTCAPCTAGAPEIGCP